MVEKSIVELTEAREKAIVKTSIIGILTNVFLVGFKAIVGLLSNSIAIILDAVNNLSDALSSVITIIGAKLGAKLPDKKHPLGYGRIEYLSSMIVAAIVLYAGITSMVESVKAIISPEKAEYSAISLIIISVAIVVKLILGQYVKRQGKKHNSGALTASGSDALFDAILSASVLASAIIYLIWGISLEAYVGVIISVFIIKAGVEMMIETVNDILGKRGDKEETDRIKKLICEEPEVRGAYDLIMFNFGPSKNYASVHIELPDTMTVDKVDELTRRIQAKIYLNTGVILTGVGVYSYNTSDNETAKIRNAVQKIVLEHDWALQLHGFYADTENKTIRFDVVVSFDIDRAEALDILTKEVSSQFPGYSLQIVPDIDA
ncbi:cation diffusion facilitator family transporter [uncultured Ruminococcus sp.]|uniref:cation diffusion facilitator family transporter n=1 Tax=uncultured Ruminococcus sp. TaxID=165186 RepID=UPI00292DE611|nr:cation diffusion facilitator family transporter [uncultured Ruminococcus sp.]